MVNLYITYDNPSGVYYPGQTVTGKVVVSSAKPFSCKGIDLECCGIAKVHWTESENRREGEGTESIHYSAEETYYSLINKLWGDGYTDHLMQAGELALNFAFILPYNSPASFESEFGYVRHICKARVHLPFLQFDKRCNKPFSVSSMLDLNATLPARAPIQLNNSKTVCCLCCASGPISYIMRIGCSGFVPGESIRLSGECQNESSSRIKSSSATLYQKITYTAQGKSKVVSREVCHVSRPEIPPGGDDTWPGVPLLVPPLPPSDLPGCNIIDIKYFLEFAMTPSGLSITLSSRAPITIGTIPLCHNMMPPAQPNMAPFVPSNFPPQPQAANPNPSGWQVSGAVPSAPPMGAMAEAPPPYVPIAEKYPNLPPPKYGLCAFGNEPKMHVPGVEDDDGPFTPQYVTFDVSSYPIQDLDDAPLIDC